MAIRSHTKLALTLFVLVGGGTAARGADLVCVPSQGGTTVVDKEVLAARLLQKYPISITAVDPAWLAKIDAAKPNSWILGNMSHLCTGNAKCSDGDKTSIAAINGMIGELLANQVPGFSPTATPSDVGTFFQSANSSYEVACNAAVAEKNATIGSPTTKAAATISPLSGFRVRSTPDQLSVDRSAGTAFSGDSPASLSVLRDGVAKTSTYKVSGTVGYAFFDSSPTDQVLGTKVIGYVNSNYSDVKAFSGAPKPPVSNTIDLGIVGSSTLIGGNSAIGFSLRPDYLWDFNDHSQLVTLNARAVPYFRTGSFLLFPVNAYAVIPNTIFSYEPTIDLRLDAGRYTRNGSNQMAISSPSVVRFGTQVGLNLVSDDNAAPLSFSASYTYMDALVGPRDIGWLSTTLTYSLDPNKYVGISLIYNNGVLEDNAKRQEQTSLALSVKY